MLASVTNMGGVSTNFVCRFNRTRKPFHEIAVHIVHQNRTRTRFLGFLLSVVEASPCTVCFVAVFVDVVRSGNEYFFTRGATNLNYPVHTHNLASNDFFVPLR